MLGEYFMVGLVMAIIELSCVWRFPRLERWIMKDGFNEIVFSLAFGVVLSVVLQIPPGVTLSIGALFSTFITKAVYTLELKEKWQNFRVKWHDTRQRMYLAKLKAKNTAEEFAAITHSIYMLVKAPFRATRWVLRKVNRGCEMASEASQKIKTAVHR